MARPRGTIQRRCRPPAHVEIGRSSFMSYAEPFGWKYAQFSTMQTIKFVLIVALILGNVFCQDVDADSWTENKWPNSDTIQGVLIRLTRKPGPRQYLGLMGKINSAKTQRARKRYTFQTFVGLMGKRSFGDEGALAAAHRSEDY